MTTFSGAFEALLATLDRLEIPFLIGGSVASGTHGLPRHTNDIDIVANIALELVDDFCAAVSPDFYVDSAEVQFAIRTARSFTVIHFESSHKFDIFPAGEDRFVQSQLARRRYTTTSVAGLENIEFPVASPEDTILAKLMWFRKGGEVSDRQWHDILGVISVQAQRLDLQYLQSWAGELGVADLLASALKR